MRGALAVVQDDRCPVVAYGRGSFGSDRATATHDPYTAEVSRLREELEAAREEIRYLKEMLTPPGLIFPARWRLTTKEATLLRSLMAARALTKEQLLIAIYDTEPEVEIKIVDVFVCKLRQKVRLDGIEIETMWGTGYRLAPDMKALVTAAALATEKGVEWVSPLANAERPSGPPAIAADDRIEGAVLRKTRLALGLEEFELATLARVSLDDVHKVEAGRDRPRARNAMSMALRLEAAREGRGHEGGLACK